MSGWGGVQLLARGFACFMLAWAFDTLPDFGFDSGILLEFHLTVLFA